VQRTEISLELADVADVLSDQLRVHLQRLAAFLLPHADTLDRRFLAKLKERSLMPASIPIELHLTAPCL